MRKIKFLFDLLSDYLFWVVKITFFLYQFFVAGWDRSIAARRWEFLWVLRFLASSLVVYVFLSVGLCFYEFS